MDRSGKGFLQMAPILTNGAGPFIGLDHENSYFTSFMIPVVSLHHCCQMVELSTKITQKRPQKCPLKKPENIFAII
jgi:hypothetical protein